MCSVNGKTQNKEIHFFKLWYLYNRVQQYNKNKVWFFEQICSGANCCSTDLCNNHSSKKRSTKKRNPKTQGLILSLGGLLWYNHSVTFSLSSYWFDYIDIAAFSRRQTLSAACADVDNLACTLLFTSNTDICQNDCIANVICPRLCGKCSEFNIFFLIKFFKHFVKIKILRVECVHWVHTRLSFDLNKIKCYKHIL